MKGAEAIFAAASRAELDRRYADELSGPAGEDPWRSGQARAAFRARRELLRAAGDREAGPPRTRQEWLAAWFDPAVSEEALREAMPDAGPSPASREELEGILSIRPQWLSVRTDPSVPAALLDSYRKRCLHPDGPLPELGAIPGARKAAFRLRAFYPGLWAVDAGVLEALLSPNLDEWPPPPRRKLHRRPERSNAWILIAVLLGLLAASRACRESVRSRPAPGSRTRTETFSIEEALPRGNLPELIERHRRLAGESGPEAEAERERVFEQIREILRLPEQRAPPEDPGRR